MGCAFFADVGDAAIMANTVAPVFYKLLYMSLTSLSIGVVILLIRRLADKQFSPFWKYAMWGLVLAALIIPWRPPSDFTLMNTTEKVQEISFRDEYVRAQTDYDDQTRLYSMIGQEESAIPDPLGQIAEITEIKTEAETLHLKTLLFDNLIPALWLLGAVILGIFMILSALGLVRNIEKAKITTKTEQTQRYEIVLQRCKEKLGIRRSVQVVIQSYVKTPALFGLFHPRLFCLNMWTP